MYPHMTTLEKRKLTQSSTLRSWGGGLKASKKKKKYEDWSGRKETWNRKILGEEK